MSGKQIDQQVEGKRREDEANEVMARYIALTNAERAMLAPTIPRVVIALMQQMGFKRPRS